MDTRRNTNQRDRSRSMRVPQRPGVSLRRSTPKTPEPIIPLLDEKKPVSRTARIKKLPTALKRYPKRTFLALCLLLIVGYVIAGQLSKKDAATTQKGVPGYTSTKLSYNETPKFDTVLPSGKSIKDYGGWTRISPEGRVPVYAYADKLDGVTIRVSQQEIPANLTADSEKAAEGVQKLASDFKADQKLTVGSTTAFIGTSAKGPQSVIFAKNELLILITSDKKIENDQWSTYISSLE